MGNVATVPLTILAVIYDVVTLPIYFLLQKPWKKWRSQNPKLAETTTGDPSGPYRRFCNNTVFLETKTLDNLFRMAVKKHGNRKMIGTREILKARKVTEENGKVFNKLTLGIYKWKTLKEVDLLINNIALSLRTLGLNPGDIIIILAETREEWFLIAHACFRTNIRVATCYNTLGNDGIIYVFNEVESRYLFTTGELITKIKKFLHMTPKIQHIIYFEDFELPNLEGFPENVIITPFSALKLTSDISDIQLEAPSPDDIAILMYTSGSTGEPKGVLIPHKCIINTLQGIYDGIGVLLSENSIHLAYLPLAHIYELAMENIFLLLGVSIGYSSSLTLMNNSPGIDLGRCEGDIIALRPTNLCAVPMLLDKIVKSVLEGVEAKGIVARILFKFFLNYKIFWKKNGFQTPILNRLLFDDLRRKMGGRVEIITSGGAPLSPETKRFIETFLDVNILRGYGLTETAGSGTVCLFNDENHTTVGPPLSTAMLRLVEWEEGNYRPTDKPYPRGEIVIGGECVSAGYFKKEELTRECFREEDGVRWFYTGDIAEVLPDGSFRIIDRRKDLLKLKFGEYLSLGKVESKLKTCPLIDNICVFGNGFLDYVVALVIPNRVRLENLAKQLNKEKLNFQKLCDDKEIINEATKIIQEHGKSSNLMRVEIPRYIKLCWEEWVPETGFVTASFKVRRKYIENYYKEELKNMIRNQ